MKLHIGGEHAKEGWHILNIQSKSATDYVGDISNLSQFQDHTCTAIYASHVFEHVRQSDIVHTLQGIFRVLKSNGEFYISVPDMDELCRLFLNHQLNYEQRWHVMRMMFGGQIDKFDFHYVGWNFEFLFSHLSMVGFSQIQRVDSFDIFSDTSDFAPYGNKISLNIIATKK